MADLTDKAVKVLDALIGIAGEYAHGKREGVTVWTEELNVMTGGPEHVPFRDEAALRACADWCAENGLPLLTMMVSADERGEFPDQMSSKLAFKHGIVPSRLEMKKAWRAEQEEIAALGVDGTALAAEALREDLESLNASNQPASRRALANARVQEIEPRTTEEWLDVYQEKVFDIAAPDEPFLHSRFMDKQEGYKERAWSRWRDEIAFGGWDEQMIGGGEIARSFDPTYKDNDANWITKRFGGFDLSGKLSEKANGIERFERAAYGFYVGDLVAKDFFEETVELLGRQYSAVTHLMFIKDKDSFVPVKPDTFEAGLRKLGIEFYLSGFCSWDNYTRFLGYLERIRELLAEREPEASLLDAHSMLWMIGSGYWLDGEGAEKLEMVRQGLLKPEDL